MNELLKKNPTTMPINTHKYFKEKRQLILTEIRGKQYMEKLNTNLTPLKMSGQISKNQ